MFRCKIQSSIPNQNVRKGGRQGKVIAKERWLLRKGGCYGEVFAQKSWLLKKGGWQSARPDLVTFSKIIWKQCCSACPCSSNLTLPRQPQFDKQFFQRFEFSSFFLKINFVEVTLTCLGHFSVLLLVLITFRQFWSFSKVLEKNQEIQDGGSKMASV